MTLTRVVPDINVRVLRVGVGTYNGNWFARIDLWSFGWRLTK